MRGRRVFVTAGALVVVLALGAGPALACGGLVSPNGTIQLVRTTTMAAYHHGLEHYVTSFKFVGGGAEFGSIVPLPANPQRILHGGDWTLQRLEIEVRRLRHVCLHSLVRRAHCLPARLDDLSGTGLGGN